MLRYMQTRVSVLLDVSQKIFPGERCVISHSAV
jgi:hypothetical protein